MHYAAIYIFHAFLFLQDSDLQINRFPTSRTVRCLVEWRDFIRSFPCVRPPSLPSCCFYSSSTSSAAPDARRDVLLYLGACLPFPVVLVRGLHRVCVNASRLRRGYWAWSIRAVDAVSVRRLGLASHIRWSVSPFIQWTTLRSLLYCKNLIFAFCFQFQFRTQLAC